MGMVRRSADQVICAGGVATSRLGCVLTWRLSTLCMQGSGPHGMRAHTLAAAACCSGVW